MATTTVRGGIDALERKRSSDDEEKFEPRNERETDGLNDAIADIIGYKPVMILSHQFEITNPLTRPEYITYDRYYPQLNLLVDFSGEVVKDTADKEGRDADAQRHKEFAKSKGIKFLMILDDKVDPAELRKAVG